MIERNLGNPERGLRLLLSVVLAAWALRRQQLGAPESLVLLAASFLFLNAISARCYLWRTLGISSASGTACGKQSVCPPRKPAP